MEEASHGISGVGVCVGLIRRNRGGNGDSQHLSEAQREKEADEDVDEHLGPRRLDGLIARIVARIAAPAYCKAEHGRRK